LYVVSINDHVHKLWKKRGKSDRTPKALGSRRRGEVLEEGVGVPSQPTNKKRSGERRSTPQRGYMGADHPYGPPLAKIKFRCIWQSESIFCETDD